MPVIQCPQCQKSLNLKQMPAGGRIKCPGCGNAIPVGGAQAGSATPRTGTQGPLTPGDQGFDFNQIQFPSAGPVAVSAYPTDPYSRTAYQGPIPGDPLGEYIGQRPVDPDPNDTGKTKGNSKGKLSPVALAGILGGVFAFLLIAIVIGTVFSGGGGGGAAEVSGSPASPAADLAAMKTAVPAGYELVEIAGAAIYLPKGEEVSTKLNTVMEYRAVRSSTTQSNFFFGSMPETAAEIEPESFRKRIAAQLKGGFLGGTPFERKGYKGIKGRLDQSLFVADMQIEAFHVDGRIFVLGVGPASMGADVETQMQIDRAAEGKEIATFEESFVAGPRPAGGLFW